ncbi:hypothetical protein WSM22_42590 [Cytophagales bacterium WSM2-2]|nr:hypothetical protein WSM22_42590 [Cytophagales bacterium WSM2-2]
MLMPHAFEAGSSFAVRMGYNSNILAASRTLGFNQFGLSPGISYFHKSGLYLDATAYWSQEYSPSLYLTIPSVGYLKSIKKWTLNLEYSRYIYSFSDSTYNPPYTNALGLTNFLEVKPFLLRLDYAFYFGEKAAHRIMPTVMLNLEKKNWHGIRRILLYPSFTTMLGNDSWQIQEYVPFSTIPSEILFRIRHNLPLYYLKTDNYSKFGVLNYSLSLPLSISVKNWTFLMSYTYNFQQPLPDDPYNQVNNGYLSFSITKYFNFKSHSVLTDLMKMSK